MRAWTRRPVIISLGLCGLVAAMGIWIGWSDLALTDEGYLWYGTQRRSIRVPYDSVRLATTAIGIPYLHMH